MLGLIPAVIGALATGLLAAAAVWGRALTPAAGAVAAAFGIVIVVLAGFPYLILLAVFVVGSTLATRYRFEEKRRASVQEGTHGERGVSNVVAHILIPTGLAVAGGLSAPLLTEPQLALLYTAALAFAASDTFASEFGVLAGKARSILTMKPVPPGTNGGISGLGEAWALVGAWSIALIGLGLFVVFDTPVPPLLFFVVTATVAGFVACQVDSVLGETLENRGYLTKGSTNFLGMLSAVAIAGAVLVAAR